MNDEFDALDTPDAVDVLIAEYLDALDHNSAPSRGDWLGQHPEHAVELDQFLDDLERLTPAPRRTATPDETQMLSGDAPPQPRDSDTIAWNADATASERGSALPFGGNFGEYELLELIARGGMGVVFKARHRRLDRVVALKMIIAGNLAGEREIQRFQAEAQAAAKLDHPGVVPVFEVGQRDGLHFFTMAFIEGKSLAARLRTGPLPAPEAARLVRDLASAIAYAHEHGIVHRDLKPANVLIDAQGQPKLTDFGLAKQTQSVSDMTGTGQILGTPGYMSPEQAQGDALHVGPAADVYGLGALLFALMTGRPPFQGSSAVDTIQHVISVEPPRPRSLNPSVPRDLETICLKCLEKAPEKRYASAAALKEDLERFLDDQPILARPVGVLERTYRLYRRHPVVGTMAASLALLLLAVPMLLGGMLFEAEGRARAEKDGHDKEKSARQRIENAERERTRQLFQAYVNEAAARRTSPRVGRAFNALGRIKAALGLAVDLPLATEDHTRLRSEALGALSLVDVRITETGSGWHVTHQPAGYAFRTAKDCYLNWDKPDGLLVQRCADGQIIQRVPVESTIWDQNNVHLSPDNRFVSSKVGNKLSVWQVDGDKPQKIARHDNVEFTSFAPDRAELLVLAPNRHILIQPLNDDGEVKTITISEFVKDPRPSYWQHAIRSGPNRVAAVAGLRKVFLVDLDNQKVSATVVVPGQIQDIVWSRAGDYVAIASGLPEPLGAGVLIYHVASKSLSQVNTTHGGPERLCFDDTGELLLAFNEWTSFFSVIRVAEASVALRAHQSELDTGELNSRPSWWQATPMSPHQVLSLAPQDGSPNHNHSVVHPAGRLLATPTSRGIALTDLATARRVGFLGGGSTIYCCFDADGNLFAQRTGPDGLLHPHRWTVKRNGDRYEFGAAERINFPGRAGLTIGANGRFIAQGGWNGASVLDRETGKSFALEPQHDVRWVCLHPKEPLVATLGFSSEGFRLWDATNGKLLHIAGKGGCMTGHFTPDGKYLVTHASDQPGLALWSMPDCKFVRHFAALGAFAISPDSKYVAVGERNGKVNLSRISDGALMARFDAPGEDYIGDATFSSDGRYLTGLNVDRSRRHIWDLWKLRGRLADMKLDWETAPAPAAPEFSKSVEVITP